MKRLVLLLAVVAVIQSCRIENDIPYPIVEGSIEAMEVEGQCDAPAGSDVQAGISTSTRTVTLYVDDTVDLTRLRVNKLTVSNGASIAVDEEACVSAGKFPTEGFETPDNLADTRINFTNSVGFTLHTYQDYRWTVRVNQVIEREIDVDGQVRAVVDTTSRVAIIYVSPEQELDNIQVNVMNLGGKSGTVSPDPTTVHDFTQAQTFYVARGWEETFRTWTVYVYHSEEDALSSEVFAMTSRAYLTGTVQSGKTPEITYKEETETDWSTLAQSYITVSGTTYTATFPSLEASSTYIYKVSVDGKEGSEQSFTTAPQEQLENASFDNWSSTAANNGTLWQPWGDGDDQYWDTGNKGATTIADSNTIPTDDTSSGRGKAALLQSQWRVMKLASGSLFAGTYVKTDGTNGVLQFGRPFTSFPTGLRFQYKYTSSTINRCAEDALEYLKGRPDSCFIYIALSDKDAPYDIRTRPSERQLFDPNDANVIAYGEFISAENVSTYREVEITLSYRSLKRTPKYLVVVATASKYGDYFVGGDATKLWLDEMELVYE